MLYHIFFGLSHVWSPLNVFQYITFRAGGAILTSLLICFIIGPFVIRKLKEMKVGQTVRKDGPSTHKVKAGTPTMGGLLIIISIIISVLLWAKLDSRFIIWLTAGTVWFGALGFFDDYYKLKGHDTKGVSAKGKLFFQTVFAASLAAYLSVFPANPEFATLVSIPYLKSFFINLSFLYIVFAMVVVVSSSNAVNLTDGLDGLAIGNIVIVAFTLAIFAYLAATLPIANYLKIVPVAGAGEISVFLAAVVGAGLGFLWYNAHPAEVFMGDTGSLALGGVIGMSAVFIKQEIILLVLGGVFVMEALSVVIQVSYFKRTKKRFFKMAPLHHHFELAGQSETKVTIRFWIIGILLAILSFASLKLR